MASKYELAISTDYVPDWGLIEAFRELFQNALDNEIVNSENKMEWHYIPEEQKLLISNRTSVLEADTLLLGSGTKHNDERTIGKHGEGYKIAFMVLLRNDKKIKVYNYGKRETWDVKLVKSKRYNGKLLTTVIVDKEAFWAKVPNNNLTIEVTGITTDEYVHIVNRNLHLRASTITKASVPGRGSIILNKEEKGNIYVKGLFVSKIENLQYGYDFEPNILALDRDRKLVDTFDVSWEASMLWSRASETNNDIVSLGVDLVNNGALDVQYLANVNTLGHKLKDAVTISFMASYGDNAIPVTDNTEYTYVAECTNNEPVIVRDNIAKLIKNSKLLGKIEVKETTSIKQQLRMFADKISHKLTIAEAEELLSLIDKVNN